MTQTKVGVLADKLINVFRFSGMYGLIGFVYQHYLLPRLKPLHYVYSVRAESLKGNLDLPVVIKRIKQFDQLTLGERKQLRLFLTYSNLSSFQKEINKGAELLLGYYHEELFGYYCIRLNRSNDTGITKGSAFLSPGDAYLFDMEVFLPFRRKGLGTAFIYKICTVFFHESVPTIWCKIHSGNVASIHLHEQCGFCFISKSISGN